MLLTKQFFYHKNFIRRRVENSWELFEGEGVGSPNPKFVREGISMKLSLLAALLLIGVAPVAAHAQTSASGNVNVTATDRALFDTDRNGIVTRGEFNSLMGRIDANHDGSLSASERANANSAPAAANVDGSATANTAATQARGTGSATGYSGASATGARVGVNTGLSTSGTVNNGSTGTSGRVGVNTGLSTTGITGTSASNSSGLGNPSTNGSASTTNSSTGGSASTGAGASAGGSASTGGSSGGGSSSGGGASGGGSGGGAGGGS